VVHHLEQAGSHRAVRFLENHDEERAATRFPHDLHQVAALVALTLPGLRLYHQGQLAGARRKLPVQLGRAPVEAEVPEVAAFYRGLRAAVADPVLRGGRWQLLRAAPAWPGNGSHEGFVVYGWDRAELPARGHRMMVANLAPHRAQCRVPVPLPGLAGRQVAVREVFAAGASPRGDAVSADGRPIYRRDGDELGGAGLFVDLPARTGQLLALEV